MGYRGCHPAIREVYLTSTSTAMTSPEAIEYNPPCMSLDGDDRPLSTAQLHLQRNDGPHGVCIPASFQTAQHLENIVKLTHDMVALRKTQCAPGNTPVQRFGNVLDIRLQLALQLTPAQLQQEFPKHRFHPYVDIFMRCAEQEGLFDWIASQGGNSMSDHADCAAARRRMLTSLRQAAREPAVRKRVRTHRNKVSRNLKSIKLYTDALFDAYSRLLVIRVDCEFVKGFDAAQDWTLARGYRASLIKYLSQELLRQIQTKKSMAAKDKPEPIAGYIIGTEYGIETGWHFHVTLFLDGESHQNDVGIAARIGTEWCDRIAGGQGRYYNCNKAAREGVYEAHKVGVGMVHREDRMMRAALDAEVAKYPGKGCYYAQAQVGPNDKLLSKGAWPEREEGKGGRPATKGPDAPVFHQQWSERDRRFKQAQRRKEPPVPPPCC